ncbi:MAG: class I SAM-dependent methyltransferase [Bacteroidales bacterium]|nr:class I SAM-dependent methyltransferase [Bacteroidales bacterium]
MMPISPVDRTMMSRIGKAFKAFGILIRNPWKLNLVIDENDQWESRVQQQYKLKSLPVIPFGTFVQGPVDVEPYAFLDGGSLPTDLALLKLLATRINGCKYFEIGTWRGESVANVAAVADICYTLNLPDSELATLSGDDNLVASQRLFSNSLANVKHLQGNSSTFDFGSLNVKFDLVFIDGDHHYPAIVNDTKQVLQHLCHPHTVVVWHDYGYNPEKLRFEIMAAILDACPPALHPFLYHVENTNCAILIREKFATSAFEKYKHPGHYFSVQLNLKPL